MKRKDRRLEQRERTITTRHLLSWAAGVLDARLRVRLIHSYSATHGLPYIYGLVQSTDAPLVAELERALGVGRYTALADGAHRFTLRPADAYQIAPTVVPLLMPVGRARVILRCLAAWHTTMNIKDQSGSLPADVVQIRQRILRQLTPAYEKLHWTTEDSLLEQEQEMGT